MKNPVIFVSYSHKDQAWFNKICEHLECLVTHGKVEKWTDEQLTTGDRWYETIKNKLQAADILVCLISRNFLGSEFCTKEEVNYLIEYRQKKLQICPILISPCYWSIYEWIGKNQIETAEGKSLSYYSEVDQHEFITNFTKEIHSKLNHITQKTNNKKTNWTFKILEGEEFLNKEQDFIGCKEHLKRLDHALKTDKNIISIIGDGGVGKSALVRHWIQEINNVQETKISQIYVWSFYQQGTKENSLTVDQFFDCGLEKLDIQVPKDSATQYKAQRFAQAIQEKKLLLLLDGIESLQYAEQNGSVQSELPINKQFKNPAFAEFLTQLSHHNKGLCVITSRQTIPTNFVPENLKITLNELEDSAIRIILRKAGFTDNDEQLRTLTNYLDGNALATKLLARNLSCKRIQAKIRGRDFKGTPQDFIAFLYQEADNNCKVILKLLGLFDRPIEVELLKNLTKEQSKAHSNTTLNTNIEKLVKVGLIEEIKVAQKAHIDCHPITREFFYEKAKEDENFWQTKNQIIYNHYFSMLKNDFSSYQDVINLILAIRHGVECDPSAPKSKPIKLESIYTLYNNKANQNDQSQIINNFGSLELDLACLSYFFKAPENESNDGGYKQLKSGIQDRTTQGAIYSWIAYALFGLGELGKAKTPMKEGFETRHSYLSDLPDLSDLSENEKVLYHYKATAVSAANLTDLYLTQGRLKKSLEWAQNGSEVIEKGLNSLPKAAKIYELQYEQAYNGAITAVIKFYENENENDHEQAKLLFEKAEDIHIQAAKKEAEKEVEKEVEKEAEEYRLVGTYGFYYCQYLLHELSNEQQQVADKFEELLTRAKLIQDNPEKTQHHLHLSLAFLVRANAYYIVSDYIKAQQNIQKALEHSQKAGFSFYRCLALLIECKTFIKLREFDNAWKSLDKVFQIATGQMDLILIQYHITCCDLLHTLILSTASKQKVIIESKRKELHVFDIHSELAKQVNKIEPIINRTGAKLYQAKYKQLKQISDSLNKE